MKNIDTCVGKYYCINDSTYVYIFPGKGMSRLRTDDMEMVYWQENRRIGAGVLNNHRDETKIVLFYDNRGDSSVKQMKPGMYKVIKKRDWCRGIIKTLFDPKFQGIEGLTNRDDPKLSETFFDGLSKII